MDRDAMKYIRKAKTLLDAIAKDNAAGEWERVAQDELRIIETGLKWVATPTK